MNTVETHSEKIFGNEDICAKLTIEDLASQFCIAKTMKDGEQYTISFWLRTDSAGSITVCGVSFAATAEWAKYELTFTADTEDLLIYFGTVGTYYLYHTQLEVGNVATAWSPAPEDFEKAIYDMDSVLENVQDSVGKLSVTAGEIKASVGTVNETINSKTGELNSRIEEVASTTVTSKAFKIEIERVVNEGVSKVSNTSGTFDSTGLTVDNRDTPTKTNVNPDGVKVLKKTGSTSEVVLSASSEGVHAKNLYASTYLSVGNRSRFENYGSNYTGCFWTGD